MRKTPFFAIIILILTGCGRTETSSPLENSNADVEHIVTTASGLRSEGQSSQSRAERRAAKISERQMRRSRRQKRRAKRQRRRFERRRDRDGDGFSIRKGDCNDKDPTIYPGAQEIANDGIDQDCDEQDLILDVDGDSYSTEEGDCDDDNPSINPAAVEICDQVDNNCNGATDEDASDAQTWYLDNDGDGFPTSQTSLRTCVQPAGYMLPRGDSELDCDEGNPAIHPGALEIANDGIDQNCDGEDLVIDADGDGYTPADGDCDDDNPSINPAAVETCDQVDNNCNGATDENASDAQTWYLDNDGDGWPTSETSQQACVQPAGYILRRGWSDVAPSASTVFDCEDSRADINPGSMDDDYQMMGIMDYDGVDSDCSGSGDTDRDGWVNDEDCSPDDPSFPDFGGSCMDYHLYVDWDGDGFSERTGYLSAGGDCGQYDSNIFPGAVEIPNDGVDQDCDGQDLVIAGEVALSDVDGDGVARQDDCDDSNANSTIKADDNDCDSFLTALDCNDSDASLLGTNVDFDCDGRIDAEDVSTGFQSMTNTEFSCRVDESRAIQCWGDKALGITRPPSGEFAQVSVGPYHACAVATDGSVQCWGSNQEGQGTPPSLSFVQVSAGGFHTCGIDTNGSVRCWGHNYQSQVYRPAAVASATFTQVSAGLVHTCGITTSGSVLCWGGSSYHRPPPSGTFVDITTDVHRSCAIDAAGEEHCW